MPGRRGPHDWPTWAREPVLIVDYDQGWALQAARERQRLLKLLGPWLLDDIHHVESTAIPGMPAKPIIDLMAGVASLNDAPAIARVLAPQDWYLVPPELDARPWRRLLARSLLVTGSRTCICWILARRGGPSSCGSATACGSGRPWPANMPS